MLLAVTLVAMLVSVLVGQRREAATLATGGESIDEVPLVAATADPVALAVVADRVASIERPLAVWRRVADCESGEWNGNAVPVPGTARWTYGTRRDTRFEGGLHFEPSTWDRFRDDAMPGHAGAASPLSQIVVAERVLDEQGWEAWPVCSEKVGVSG